MSKPDLAGRLPSPRLLYFSAVRLSAKEPWVVSGPPRLVSGRAASEPCLSGLNLAQLAWHARRPSRLSCWRSTCPGCRPPYIFSAEYDPLCDDGEAYATQLADAGVITASKEDTVTGSHDGGGLELYGP
jgi:acetyl esterase/lipase